MNGSERISRRNNRDPSKSILLQNDRYTDVSAWEKDKGKKKKG